MRTEPAGSEPVDVVALDEASKYLLGYYVHRRFHNYLSSVTAALRRQAHDGLYEGLTRPTPRGRAAPLDVRALNYDGLVDLAGTYLYVLSCHKSANWRLMHHYEGKQVLHLRGYDFETAFRAGDEMATGLVMMDAVGFALALPALLPHRLFKVLSPKEADTETVSVERYYDSDADALIQWTMQRPGAVYLNARDWKAGVLALLPRMDHYVVYVSSLTESALWELEQLNTDHRRGRVTVVFDERAVDRKVSHLALQEALGGTLGAAIWTKQGGPPSLTAAQVRDGLAEVFTVVSPEAFKANIGDVVCRIDDSHAELRPGERETWLDFAFSPAMPDDDVLRLRLMSERLGALVDAGRTSPIDCLPLYVAQLQLRIYATLLFGEHAATGRTLAAYAAVMQGVADHGAADGEGARASSEEDRTERHAVLSRHAWFAEYAGRTLLSYGRSHEFASRWAQTNVEWDAIIDATRVTVGEALSRRGTPPS